MLTKPVIYVDMDGVLTDLDASWRAMFGRSLTDKIQPGQGGIDAHKLDWLSFVDACGFETLEPIKGSGHLCMALDQLKTEFDIEICILTAAGGYQTMADVATQKILWLQNQCIDYGPIVVPYSHMKQVFADPKALLIDDLDRNCEQFRARGGSAIQHSHHAVEATVMDARAWCMIKADLKRKG